MWCDVCSKGVLGWPRVPVSVVPNAAHEVYIRVSPTMIAGVLSAAALRPLSAFLQPHVVAAAVCGAAEAIQGVGGVGAALVGPLTSTAGPAPSSRYPATHSLPATSGRHAGPQLSWRSLHSKAAAQSHPDEASASTSGHNHRSTAAQPGDASHASVPPDHGAGPGPQSGQQQHQAGGPRLPVGRRPMTLEDVERACWSCDKLVKRGGLVCNGCETVQPPDDSLDYFELFSL
jgi:hypothetical protein